MPLLKITVNGQQQSVEADPSTLLVDLLRGPLGLTGTHVGCDTSQCGACTVLMDGLSVKSCSVLAGQAAGRSITTIEGMSRDGQLHSVQQAFIDCHGLQCGFCTPGMVMTAACLLAKTPQPSEGQIVDAIEGNLCRCTGYVNIVASVQKAASTLSGAQA